MISDVYLGRVSAGVLLFKESGGSNCRFKFDGVEIGTIEAVADLDIKAIELD